MIKIYFHQIVDKLFILFLILNILFIDDLLLGFNIRYYILIFLFFSSFVDTLRFTKSSVRFLMFSLIIFIYLFLYSFILKQNKFENIISILQPYFFLICVFPLNYLLKYYNINRYLKVVYILIGILVIYFIALNIIFLYSPSTVFHLALRHKILDVSYDGGIFPRIIIRNFVLLLPLYFYLFLKSNNILFKIILTVVVVLLILLSYTLGLFLGLAFGLIIVFIQYKGILNLLYFIPFLFIISGIYFIKVRDNIVNERKSYSIDIKNEQINNYSKDMSELDWFFGRGVGVEFSHFDDRNGVDTKLEVGVVQAFQFGGVIGFSIIFYIYTFHFFKYLRILILKRKLNPLALRLFLAQGSIFASSLANPYIWSGGVGLLFVVLLLLFESKNVQTI